MMPPSRGAEEVRRVRTSGEVRALRATLAERALSDAKRMERVLADGFDPDRVLQNRQGTVKAGIIVSQFIHHGSDHRAHIGTIFGANGVRTPELDVWAYGRSVGDAVLR